MFIPTALLLKDSKINVEFKIYWQEMKKKLKVFSKNLIKMEMDKSPLKNLTMLIQTNKITPDPSAQAKNGILLEHIKICPLKK